jgi:hypothetical protein
MALKILFTILVLVSAAFTQTTPNINLNIPAQGTLNWDVLLNANFTQLDLLLSGNATLPALNVAGPITLSGSGPSAVQLAPGAFATLTATYTCNSTNEGMLASVNDSNTNTWGATVANGGSFHILVFCNGTNWTVAGK